MFSSSSLVITVLLSALTCTAAPLIQEGDKPVAARGLLSGLFSGPSSGIDSNLLSQFELMGQYSTAAYCSNNFNSPGDQLECPGGTCPRVHDADSITTVEYSRYVNLHLPFDRGMYVMSNMEMLTIYIDRKLPPM